MTNASCHQGPSLDFAFIGNVTICPKGWPLFPAVSDVPGLYRLEIGSLTYIGQAANLKRRFSDYRRPAQDVQTEHEVHDLIVEAGGARVSILIGDEFATEAERLAAERAAVKAAIANGTSLLNKGGRSSPADRLRARIKFLEKMLDAARARLAALEDEL